jgi:hypothetical protein
MGIGLRVNKEHLLFFLCVLLSVLVITVIVLHATTPNAFHDLAVINRH